MRNRLPIADCGLPIAEPSGRVVNPLALGADEAARRAPSIANRKSQIVNGFTLIEVMVVVVLLSLIVLALMAVFNSTQAAFRASVTQAGVLESGRAAMDLMTADLRAMAPSFGQSGGAVNFFAGAPPPAPLFQPMVGGTSLRTNALENIFILSRGNANGVPTWYAVGYAVAPYNNSPDRLYPLYRFATNHPVAAVDPAFIFTNEFRAFLIAVTNGSHLMDGVVALTVRAYDVQGRWMTTNIVASPGGPTTNKNVLYVPVRWGQVGFYMFSNTLPASVEIEMGVLEDRVLQRAESMPNPVIKSNYLVGSASQVHVFRQRVSIPNVDPAAYQ